MQLNKITLRNYGVYQDTAEFDLTTTNDKPIILIGGTNGSGKTTLFDSILLGFYGKASLDKKTTKNEYHQFLASKIHRDFDASDVENTSITIDFKFFHNGVINDYTVERRWQNNEGQIIEDLTIKKNGKRLDFVDQSQWQSFIEELIPKGIAKLFFFDGEKIVRMTEDENENTEIKSSFNSLLGLDVIEQLHSDLRVHIMRNSKNNTNTIQNQHEQYLKEQEQIMYGITRFQEILAQKNGELDDIIKQINILEGKISKIGGGFASNRDNLKKEKTSLEARHINIENELKQIIAGPLPLSIISKQTDLLKDQIKKDTQVIKRLFEKDILNEKLQLITNMLDSDKIKNEKIESNVKQVLLKEITKIFNSENTTKSGINCMFNFSVLESTNIINLIDTIQDNYIAPLKNATLQYDEISEQLQLVDISLVNAPHDDEIGPLISKLNLLHEDKGMIKNEVDHLEQQITTKNTHLKIINYKIRNILSDKYNNVDDDTKINLAGKVQNVLDQYIEQLKIRKLKILENYLLEEIQKLLHKESLITKITIDKDSFAISLYDKHENIISKELLSKGEQQMFATAVLLALAKTSGKPLPFMIDTPLARLDISHRDSLVNDFFPYASHQVVIFSTDSEINNEYYTKLLPYISRSYAIKYIPEKSKTQIQEGYF